MSKYQIPGYQHNTNDTLHKGGRDAPNIHLHQIKKQLLEYLGTFKAVQEAKKEIEKKYFIEKDDTGLWPENDIKKAWGKTLRMNWPHEKNKRAHWSIVIILQMLLQREESENDGSDMEIFTELKLNDSPEETQDYPEPSAVNIPEETIRSERGKRKCTLMNNTEEKRRKETLGIYIPLHKFKDTNKFKENDDQEKKGPNKKGKLVKLIDGKPKFPLKYNNDNRFPKLLVKTSHVVQYDNKTNNAAWVFEILNKETIKGTAKQSTYRLDYSTHKDHRAPESLEAYTDTGYERGHLAAAANHTWCQKARDDTNLLSNIVPQHAKLNRGKWKRLEDLCRLYVQDEYSKAYIYTGPLYLTKDYNIREEYGKALPTHFFKVIILEKNDGKRNYTCYEIPNEAEEVKSKQPNTIKEIEKELIIFKRKLSYIEKVSELTFTEDNPEILREEEKVVTVNFREDYGNIMITPTDEIDTIVETVEIIPTKIL